MTMHQRRSAKALTDPALWRSRVRSECLQRVKDQRAGLLWRLRQGVEGGNAEANVKLVLADIIADVSCTDTAAPADLAARETDAAAPGDVLMDEDFPDAVRGSGIRAAKASRPVRNIMDGAFGLAPGEYEELMRSMEESLFEDMRRDEAASLAEQERWEAAAAEAEVSMLVDLHAEEASTSGRTACPICCEGHLTQHNGVVLCSRGDLRMDLRVEGLTLEDVRQRLANVLDAHALQNCQGQPRFVLDTALMSNAPSLLMTCDACGALHVII
ncbi:hypothetical protein COCOBI_15-2880 [Coccomyxa sp. Obi]|nr:hypothetical protein COCOBI_15-2880 [Coccomyxa sp. Obi]